MNSSKEVQVNIFNRLLKDPRLQSGAKNQIRIFLDLLKEQEGVGFDTTSALMYGFMMNSEFTDSDTCPLTRYQVSKAKSYFYNKAIISRAQQTSLLERIAELPLSSYFNNKLDLKDLAISFLTYASEYQHFTYNTERVSRLYEYLIIPKKYFLNVWDLFHDLEHLEVSYDDFIINLSRLKFDLVDTNIRNISISYSSLFNELMPPLPNALNQLSGQQLEDFIMETYYKAGFQVIRIGGNTYVPDGGVDIIAYQNRPLEGELRFAIQCKASKNKIETEVIRGFNTSISNYKAHKGIFIAKSGFTKTALLETQMSNYNIELLDYAKLSNQLRSLTRKE